MKKFFAYVVAALFVIMAANCSKKDTEEVIYDSLKVNTQEVTMRVNKEASFGIESGSGDYGVTSADSSIATVSLSGKNVVVSGVKEGETTITVLDKKSGQKATVKAKVSAGLVELDIDVDSEVSVLSGTSTEINISAGNGVYEVVSSDPSIVKATLSGTTTVVLEAVGAGTATVTIKDVESGKEVSFGATVTEKQSITLNNVEGNEIVVKAFTEVERERASVTGEVLEATKIQVSGSGNYTVVSSDEGVAKVKVSGSEIIIDGYKTGTATITISNDVDNPAVIVAKVYALALDVNNVNLKPNESVEVTVVDGSGDYEIVGAIPSGVTASLSGDKLTVGGSTPVNNVEITIKDKVSQKEVSLGIYVTENKVLPTDSDMVLVEGGTFAFGNSRNDSEGDADEKPVSNVTLSSYKISKYEVTNAQYVEFLNAKGNQREGNLLWYNGLDKRDGIIRENGVFKVVKGRENYPVTYVSWYGAKAYAEWKGGSLPTEAQWEYAAKGGNESQNYKYSGSNNLEEVAHYLGNSKGLNPVATKKANELGIYDMSGNAWEWTADRKSNYTAEDKTDPAPNVSENPFIRRGGSVYCKPYVCRSANRGTNGFFQNNIGFRIVLPAN